MASGARDRVSVFGPALIPAGELAGRPPIPLTRPIIVAGSRNNCRIHLISRTVSKAHCLIVLTRHTVFVRDLCTREGTFVNGERLTGERDLVEGDILKIGRFEFIFSTGGARLRPHRERPAPPAVVQVAGSDAPPIPLEGRVALAGRRSNCDLAFVDSSVSTAHAVIVAWEGRRYVRDLGSRTGTFINGKRIHQQEIHPGDRIRIGTDELIYRVSETGEGVEVVASPTESAVAKAIAAQELQPIALSADDTLPAEQKPAVPEPVDRLVREPAPTPVDLPPPPRPRPVSPLDPSVVPLQTPESSAVEQDLPRRGWHRIAPDETRHRPSVSDQSLEPQGASVQPPAESFSGHLHAALPTDDQQVPENPPQVVIDQDVTANLADVADSGQGVESEANSLVSAAENAPDILAAASSESVAAPEPEPRSVSSPPSTEPMSAEEPAAPLSGAGQPAEAASEQPGRVEILIEPAEPSPDSALPLSAVEPSAAVDIEPPRSDTLSDTLVGRELAALSGTSVGEPIVTSQAPQVDARDQSQPAEGLALATAVAESGSTVEPVEPPPAIELAAPPEPLVPAAAIEVPSEPAVAGLELPAAVALPTLPEAQSPTVTLTASLPIEPPAEPEPVGPIPLVSPTPEPIYACPPEPIVPPTPSTAAPQIGAPEPIRLQEFSGTSRELDAAEPPIPPPIDLSEPPRAAPEWSELPPAPPVTLPVAEVHTPCEVEPAEPLAIRDVPTAVVEQQPMPDSTPALSLPRVEIPSEPEPSTVDLPVLETPPASVAAEIPPAEPPPLVAPDIVEPQVPAGEAPAPFMPAEPPSTELSAPPAEESIRATISLPPPSAAEPDRLPQVNEAPPQLTIAEPPAPPSPPEEPPQPPPLEIPSSAEPAASGPSLALDEVVAEIPLTVTTDDGQSLLLGETSPSSETAFALVIPPVEAPEQVSFVPPPPQLLEPMSIAPDLVHPAPANIEAPELNLVPTPEPLPPEIEIELAPRPVDTQDSTVVSGSQPETPVAPQSEPPASVEITATATLSPGQGPAAPSPSAFEPELTPPPLPANAPPLELDDSEVPLKLVPPRPRKTPGTRDSAGRAPWVADPAVPAQPSPFAAGAIAPGDPFVASPADPFTPSPAPASLDALEMAPGADPEALSGRNRPARDQRRADPAATRPARQVQQVAPAFVPSVPLATPLAPARSEEAIELEELRRRRLKWIPTMLLGSILLMAGAVAAIWHLFPVQQEVEAALRFEGFSSMSMVEQKALQAEQNALLRQDYVRKAAIRKLRELRPEVSAGFLGSPVAYDRVIMLSGWPDSRPGEFVLRYRGTDPADRYRLHALTQALFNDERTRRRIETARNERAAIRRLEEDIESNTRKLTELRKQIERERFLGENRPQPGQIEALETAVLSAERQWTDALAKLKEAQAEEARIEKLLSAARQNPPAAPENDPELSRLTQQLTDLQAEYRALQSRQSEQATLARQEIDEAMDAFQRQIEAARGRGGESPELAQYIASAENLQTTTRALLDEQLDRQQQQYQRLTELKRQLDEKAAARAAELRSSDPQLRELLDERELLRRQINAGVGAGIDRAELAPYEERLKLAESMIRAREEVLSSDPLYVDMITSLQKEIDQMQADLAANRRKIDEKLEELQKSFAASAPAVANLPEEQKQIALQVRQQLAAITAARQRYTEVLEADRRATEEKLNQMQGQIVALQSEIDTRKRILSDEFVNKSVTALTEALEAQRKVVEAAREAESLARAEFESKGRELRGLKDTVEALKNSDERMVRLIGEREQTEQFLKSLNDQLEFRRSNASTGLLEIRAPAEADVKVIAGEDRRLIYILSAVGVIVLLTSGSIWWTLHSAGKMEFVPATPEPLTGAAAAGNTLAAGAAGHDLAAVPARPGTSDGDDEQPAVV